MNDKCIMLGLLDPNGFEIINRVYSTEGISPTVNTCGGGGREIKVLLVENESNDSCDARKTEE